MPFTRAEATKLAAEVLRRYQAKYGSTTPSIRLTADTTKIRGGSRATTSISPNTVNPTGMKTDTSLPMAGTSASAVAGGGNAEPKV